MRYLGPEAAAAVARALGGEPPRRSAARAARRLTFSTWLRLQQIRDDDVGKLAKAWFADPKRWRANTARTMAGYLERVGRRELLPAVEIAWREWKAASPPKEG